ncbi:hypothetical protein DSO57_1026495 [Entomophthora muscae]|uniref:Uncharacterized protein n=1 Tax=Entomophthora muscae TaxID=34485 RepID=A0ACC2RGR9_9FUNG|nr:hypothetical protein DSO57_1026495 [Entomophthora muscae]
MLLPTLLLLAFAKAGVLASKPLNVMLHLDFGSFSHIKSLLEMGKVLEKRKHRVTFAAFDACEKYNELYQIPFISLGKSIDKSKILREQMKKGYGTRERVDTLKDMPNFFGELLSSSYDAVYPRLGEVIDQERPDVVICDFFSIACRDVAEMKGIPLITGFQTVDGLGLMDAPFLTNSMDYGSITIDSLSFTERFKEKIINPLNMVYHFMALGNVINKSRAKHGVPPATMPFGDFSTSLNLANTFVGFEPAAPLSPNVKLVGPIKSDTYHPLTPDIAHFLDTHPRTLYIAFGSQVVLADFDLENLVVGSLSALAEGSIDGIIWGLGKTILEDFPSTFTINGTVVSSDHLFSNMHPHMRLLAWAPQTAILEHKNTRLFISHGGIESTFEAILSGTPVLCMAFLADQSRNARKLEDAGVGKYVDRITAIPYILSEDIKEFMADATGSIQMNVHRMQTIALIGSRRKEAGADAIEEYAYTARICRTTKKHKYGKIPCEVEHLTMASRKMSFIKSNLIDVYFVAFSVAITSLVSIFYGIKAIFYLPRKAPETDKKKKQ